MHQNPTTKTERNLHSAFAGEAMANRKYLYFAKLARTLGNESIAKLFEEIAQQETGHAFAHLDLIYPPSELSIEKLLELALEGELYETNHMYPEFEKTARQEGDQTAEREFQAQAEESKEHARVFENAARRFKALARIEAMHAEKYQRALNQITLGGS